MELSAANLNLFFTTTQVLFGNAYKATPVWYQDLCTTYPATSSEWADAWTGMSEKVRLWKGPRVVHTPMPQTYRVAIQKFELTWGIGREQFEDDQFGVFNTRTVTHAMQLAKWPDYQVRDLIFNRGDQTGVLQKGTDGITHWNTAHPVDVYDSSKGTFCNDYRGGVIINSELVGGTLSSASFQAVYNDMGLRKTESGEAWGIEADTLAHSSHLKATSAAILNTQFIATPTIGYQGTGLPGTPNAPLVGASENVLKGWADILVIKDFGITASTRLQWLMAQAKGMPVKPFSWLLRKAPITVPRTREDDPNVFDLDEFQFGSRMRGAPAFALPVLSSISGP